MYNQSFSKIWVIVVIILIIGGFLLYKFWPTSEEGTEEKMEEAKLLSFEIIPSCMGESGWIIYPKGAKAVAKGENLSRVEFWRIPTGTGMEDMPYTEKETIKKDNQWEVSLPDILYMSNFYAIGFDSKGNEVGRIYLGPVYGHDEYAKYPEDCRE